MSPADYYDWWSYSGICPGIPTRPANYAVVQQRLSAGGVAVILLWELLRDSADWPETEYFTPIGIYGCRARIGEAARIIGAPQLAAYMPVYPDTDIVPETHREVKELLKRFAKQHDAELKADIARNGDPRSAPGFDKRKARKEIELRWGENNARYAKSDRIPFYVEPMIKLRALLAQGVSGAQASATDEAVANLVLTIQYEYPVWSQESQPDDVAKFLDECRRLVEQYPKQLPVWTGHAAYQAPAPVAPTVSQDRDVLDQLQAIGAYSVEPIGPMTIIKWDAVAALDNDLAPMQLQFHYDSDFPHSLLTTWSTVGTRFAAALPAMNRKLLSLARAAAQQLEDPELRPNGEELQSQINQGVLQIAADPNDSSTCQVQCSWDVEWDPEHGCTFEIDDCGGITMV